MSAPPSPVWTVPPPHPDFLGREPELAALEEALSAGGASALTQTAVYGLGGIGKTQLALAFAARHAERYSAGFWLPAENPTGLAVAFADLAAELHLPEAADSDQRRRTEAVKRWLASPHSGLWLLILDNAERREDVAPYLPARRRGHVLITSRNPEWRPLAKPVKVPRLPRERSVELLCQGWGGADRREADELAKELDDLPLALAQAAAFVRATACSFGDYLRQFRGRWAEFDSEQEAEPGYGRTAAVTLGMALDHLRRQNEEAAEEVLCRCAFLAPDNIPRDLLVDAEIDERVVGRAIAVLGRYSLVETAPGLVSLHRLVQKAARERLSVERRATQARRALERFHAALPNPHDYRGWVQWRLLLTHALQAVGHAETLEEATRTRAEVLGAIGTFVWHTKDLAEARHYQELALRLRETVHGPENAEVALGLNNLGLVLKDLGEFAQARGCYERALHLFEEAFGPESGPVAVTIENLGLALEGLGEFAEARRCHERALHLMEQALGPADPRVPIVLGNLGRMLREVGELAESRRCLERARRLDETAREPDDPQVAATLCNLADVLRDLGELAEARRCLEQSLSIKEKAYGSDHLAVTAPLNSLGLVLLDLGEAAEARHCLERALRIEETYSVSDRPGVATTLDGLGLVLRELGELAEARRCLERALRIEERAHGPEHPYVAFTLNKLGQVLGDLGELAEARRCLERALRIEEKAYGPEHPHVAITLVCLGEVTRRQSRLPEARRHLERALPQLEHRYGADHVPVARALRGLDQVARDEGDPIEARTHLERALAIYRARLGEGHPATAKAREDLQGIGSAAPSAPPATARRATIKLLFLAAVPLGRERIDSEGELRAIRKKMDDSGQTERIELVEQVDVRLDALPGLLTGHRPHIIHFTGHGTGQGNLLLLRDNGEEVEASPDLLSAYFRNLRHGANLRLALFNCCHSDRVAQAAVRQMDCAIGMADEVPDEAARAFAGDFYLMLASGTSVQEAYETARLRLAAEPVMKDFAAQRGSSVVMDLVKLHARAGVDPAQVVLVADGAAPDGR